MTDKTIINNWTGGGTLQTWKSGDWQILYAKDSAGGAVTLSLNEHEAARLAYAVSSVPDEQHALMREYMHAVYELSYPAARADELRQIADEIECSSRCERCPADQPDRGEFCGFVAADSLRKLAAALDAKAKVDAEAPATASAGWQPIDSAPKDGTYVLVYRPILGTRAACVEHFEKGFWVTGSCMWPGEPTHWMPLPAAPTKRSAT